MNYMNLPELPDFEAHAEDRIELVRQNSLVEDELHGTIIDHRGSLILRLA